MNDRFKFRIWDKKLKKLAKWGDNPYHNMEIMNYICVENPVTDWRHEDYILMQCTGLKDKNGKLIYEGDIVKSDFDFITNTINPLRFNIGNVIYSDYIAGFVIASDINDYSPYKTSFFGKTEALNCIVIGNIYENPELLEE